MPAQIPGKKSREADAVGLQQHEEVQAHVLRRLHGQTLLHAQQVPHDQGGIHLQSRLQNSVENAVDNFLRLPEEVQWSR